MNCQFCGHPVADHHVIGGNYEQPEYELMCDSEEINPATLTTCGCTTIVEIATVAEGPLTPGDDCPESLLAAARNFLTSLT